ncbi:zinc finger protein 503-like [Hippoglossus hippoglossus]|uniref:zinc finger protein 503-like n=1 Tax=Hippoglossus hippoglossus TaxID=8267 RepID=UPI00148C660F|nr:zinc finger protein 503-like [Hippoglossus hippoglossus]XP_035001592.1 zinc finger protein 503 [Hippoglossus stenolepis]
MITSPTVSFLRNSTNPAWHSGSSGERGAVNISRPFVHNSVSPAHPSRQASRLPIKVLKMLTARSGHILHPEYLQPLPSTPVSPIELDAKKSPLALLAQTCSQIGKPDPPSSSKLSNSNGSSDKETKSGPLKMSDIGADDKSSFKPYSKSSEKKDSSSSHSGDKNGFRVPSATCQPFTPRTGSPSSCTSVSPRPLDGKAGDKEEKKESDSNKSSTTESNGSHRISGITSDGSQHQESTSGSKTVTSDSPSVTSSSSSVLGSGLVAPVSPYKPGHTVFPMPPAGISYPGSLAGAYAGYAQPFLPHGMTLDPTKSSSQLLSAQFAAACSKAGSSPLAGASPPSLMSASLCRDPYCLSYHCSSHLSSAASANCAHDSAAAAAAANALKSGYQIMYPTHPLHSVHASAPSFNGHPLYPYGFMLPNDPLPHVCNWVSANGPCDKRFSSSEELLSHLRTHTAFAGTEKLISGYPGSSSLANAAAAAAMAGHMHMHGGPGSPGTLALRGPHHPLGLTSRYHPYSKSPLPPGAPVPVPAANGAYYSPYALYGQRLTTASALGYQ